MMIMQTRRTSARASVMNGCFQIAIDNRRDETELGDVRDAVRGGLGRRVDRVAKAELRGVGGDGEPAAEQRGDENDHGSACQAVAAARTAAAGGRIRLCSVSHADATPGTSVARNSML